MSGVLQTSVIWLNVIITQRRLESVIQCGSHVRLMSEESVHLSWVKAPADDIDIYKTNVA